MPAAGDGGQHFSGSRLDVGLANIDTLVITDSGGLSNAVTTDTPQTLTGVKSGVDFRQWGNGIYNVESALNPGGAAVGDGVADDSAAIAAAVAAANAANGIVYLPSRRYKAPFASTLIIDPYTTQLVGGNNKTQLLCSAATANPVIQIAGPTSTHLVKPAMRDLYIEGPGDGSGATNDGIIIGDPAGILQAEETRFENVHFFGFGNSIKFSSNAWLASFYGCNIERGQLSCMTFDVNGTNMCENISWFGGAFIAPPQEGLLLPYSAAGDGQGRNWRFYGTSFDACGRILNMDFQTVEMFGCHFEPRSQLATGATECMRVTHSTGNQRPRLLMNGCTYTLGAANAAVTRFLAVAGTIGESWIGFRDPYIYTPGALAFNLLVDDIGTHPAVICVSDPRYSDPRFGPFYVRTAA